MIYIENKKGNYIRIRKNNLNFRRKYGIDYLFRNSKLAEFQGFMYIHLSECLLFGLCICVYDGIFKFVSISHLSTSLYWKGFIVYFKNK